MERLQNPFSIYDFLGYLIPGSVAVYFFLILFLPENVELKKIFDHYGLERAGAIFPLTVVSYIFGHTISYLSSITVEKYSNWSVGFPSKYLLGIEWQGYWDVRKKNANSCINTIIRYVSRLILVILLLPISLLDFFVGKKLQIRFLYTRELDEFTKKVIKSKLDTNFERVFGFSNPEDTGDIPNQNFFLTIYHYCLERVNNHINKFQNYVALYGFLRSLSFLFVLFYWSLIIEIFRSNNSDLFILITLSGLLSYILYMAYNKFLRRFSLEVLMAFVSISDSAEEVDQAEQENNDLNKRFSNWVSSSSN